MTSIQYRCGSILSLIVYRESVLRYFFSCRKPPAIGRHAQEETSTLYILVRNRVFYLRYKRIATVRFWVSQWYKSTFKSWTPVVSQERWSGSPNGHRVSGMFSFSCNITKRKGGLCVICFRLVPLYLVLFFMVVFPFGPFVGKEKVSSMTTLSVPSISVLWN